MKLPRDLSGQELARALAVYGYVITRQAGSHMRLTTQLQGEHHLTIPDHASLRVGTLAAILTEVALHFQTDRSAVADKLFS
ncbi:MAG: type II toxin-antitoxin system HicA family toxin [Gemmatimonadota bacterium]|nr:type II toxin-antitoxin system HicA family toxin [Gemmatimonadota bacterium]